MSQREMYVIGGPNGAGKTTCARFLLPRRLQVVRFVNADDIAVGMTPDDPSASAFRAGRAMLRTMRGHVASGRTFGVEMTLSARTLVHALRDAKACGYAVHVVFVWLRSPDLAVERVRLRVRRGGHQVPEEVVRRRYVRGVRNFFELYQPLAETWLVCDNSESELVRVAEGRGGAATVLVPEVYDRMRRI